VAAQKIARQILSAIPFPPILVAMHESTSFDSTLIDSIGIDAKGKSLGSHIITSVMGEYPVQESWTTKNEKVRPENHGIPYADVGI
jgi:hypothetical protein